MASGGERGGAGSGTGGPGLFWGDLSGSGGPPNHFVGPRNDFIGPLSCFMGPSNDFVGSSSHFVGPPNDFVGPLNHFVGHSNDFVGPSNDFVGPSNHLKRALSDVHTRLQPVSGGRRPSPGAARRAWQTHPLFRARAEALLPPSTSPPRHSRAPSLPRSTVGPCSKAFSSVSGSACSSRRWRRGSWCAATWAAVWPPSGGPGPPSASPRSGR